MIVTLAMDQFGNSNNGTTETAMSLARELMKKGHEVRVLTSSDYEGEQGEKIYKLNVFKFPVFNPLIVKQGMCFAEPDDEVINLAIKDCDVVHIFLPFKLGRRTMELCKQNHIPFTSAFHCQAENVSYTLGLGKVKFVNSFIYSYLNKFYKQCKYVHVPSQMIKNELIKHNYKNDFFVISNGVSPFFQRMKVDRPKEFANKIIVVSTGRLSNEKRHDLTIDAIAKSKYHKYIVLIICGKGPKDKALLARSDKLDNPTIFKFCSKEELRDIYNYADFYIHSSDAEIEGLAAMEAIKCGLVPLISDSPLSATKEFAPSQTCIFKHGSSKDLANHLDYFIEHVEEKNALKEKCVELMKQYDVSSCVDQMIEMFNKAIENNKND